MKDHRRETEALQGVACQDQLPRTGVMLTWCAWTIQDRSAIESMVCGLISQKYMLVAQLVSKWETGKTIRVLK